MSTLTNILPSTSATADASLRIVDVDDDEADELFDVFSSETRRNVYRSLFEEPATASELAASVDTSVQNVSHHISVLESAALIEPVGQRYSEKGNEMVVYGPASDPLVFVGEEETRSQLERSLSEVVAGLAVLGAGALFVQWGVYSLFSPTGTDSTGIDPASHTSSVNETQGLLTWLVFDAGEPGIIFFFGALLVAGLASLALRR
ncbi:ArsR/SmtB family transcription factor [Natrialba sp. SSL1]|uniref:ArsR/SmtB family transcription factor n=1 Tax=Natrialba sp. SSL1 TaxID=1869245 RepID=UPI0008F85598|nr:helix-turn-helix domain-containing protein [Natrialba sp. SSL1]OIB56696.1 transcriptional regulator [Natrialba sp. SSL1]